MDRVATNSFVYLAQNQKQDHGRTELESEMRISLRLAPEGSLQRSLLPSRELDLCVVCRGHLFQRYDFHVPHVRPFLLRIFALRDVAFGYVDCLEALDQEVERSVQPSTRLDIRLWKLLLQSQVYFCPVAAVNRSVHVPERLEMHTDSRVS